MKTENIINREVKNNNVIRAEGKNKITATGALAVRVIIYSFALTNWRLEKTIRKPESCYKCIHCINRKLTQIGHD
jgi:predicted DNA-binding helix-hairpin-helix protein